LQRQSLLHPSMRCIKKEWLAEKKTLAIDLHAVTFARLTVL
jgi:hypothetical protein